MEQEELLEFLVNTNKDNNKNLFLSTGDKFVFK